MNVFFLISICRKYWTALSRKVHNFPNWNTWTHSNCCIAVRKKPTPLRWTLTSNVSPTFWVKWGLPFRLFHKNDIPNRTESWYSYLFCMQIYIRLTLNFVFTVQFLFVIARRDSRFPEMVVNPKSWGCRNLVLLVVRCRGGMRFLCMWWVSLGPLELPAMVPPGEF